MDQIVADTSALVSMGTVVNHEDNPLDILSENGDLVVPERVIEELEATADFDDVAGQAATAVLQRQSAYTVHATTVDASFPLDEGENAAVSLATDIGASQLLCDEFNQLSLVHASLGDTRLVTTPTLLISLVRAGTLEGKTGQRLLQTIAERRSWEGNAYVERATAVLEGEER